MKHGEKNREQDCLFDFVLLQNSSNHLSNVIPVDLFWFETTQTHSNLGHLLYRMYLFDRFFSAFSFSQSFFFYKNPIGRIGFYLLSNNNDNSNYDYDYDDLIRIMLNFESHFIVLKKQPFFFILEKPWRQAQTQTVSFCSFQSAN